MRAYIFSKLNITYVISIVLITLTSCSSDYRNVIPADSIAIMSLDVKQLLSSDEDTNHVRKDVLVKVLCIDDIEHSGIDFGKKLYAFETPDGSLGLVASIDNKKDIDLWLQRLVDTEKCSGITDRKGYKFTVLNGVFIVGYSDNALLIMGPVIGNDRSRTQKKMIKYLEADESIMDTDLYGKLDQMKGTVSLVAQADAFPESIVAPIMSATSQKADHKDVIISASITLLNDRWLDIACAASSKKKGTATGKDTSSYELFGEKYVDCIDTEAMISVLCGINGDGLITGLRKNEALRTMLVGLNTAIDIDKMIKSIDGDLLLSIQSVHEEKFNFRMIADTDNSDWLSDVSYWKESTPAGSRIADCKSGGYCFSNSDLNLYFGMKDNRTIYMETSENPVDKIGRSLDNQLPDNIKASISGKRLCAIVNLNKLFENNTELKAMSDMASPVLGNVKMIVFSIK